MLAEAGYRTRRTGRELVLRDEAGGIELFFLRPRDIAVYVGQGAVHAGITGRDLLLDSGVDAVEHLPLGFARSTFRFAAPAGTMSSLNGRRNTAISSARSTRRPRHSSPGCPPGHKLRVSLRPHWLSSLLTQPTISSSPSPPPMRAPSSLMKPRGPAHASESRSLTPAEHIKSNGSTPSKCYVTPVSPLTFPALPTKSKRGTSNQPVTNASTRLEMQHSPTPPDHE